MSAFRAPPLSALRSTIDRLADDAAARLRSAPTPLRSQVDELRDSLEPVIDGYRHSAIGISGVFAADRSQSIASLLAQSVVEREHLTTTIARVTRRDVLSRTGESSAGTRWKCRLRPQSLNIWPSARAESDIGLAVDPLALLHWLRAKSEFSLVTFDSLGDVIARLALARRLDGLVIVHSGQQFDLELMSRAVELLERKGVRLLGQVINAREEIGRGERSDRRTFG